MIKGHLFVTYIRLLDYFGTYILLTKTGGGGAPTPSLDMPLSEHSRLAGTAVILVAYSYWRRIVAYMMGEKVMLNKKWWSSRLEGLLYKNGGGDRRTF